MIACDLTSATLKIAYSNKPSSDHRPCEASVPKKQPLIQINVNRAFEIV